MVSLGIADKELRSVTLLEPLPRYLRLDVLPFGWLYCTGLYLGVTRALAVDRASSYDQDALTTLFFALTLFVHALTLLSGEWSVHCHAWLAYTRASELRTDVTQFVLVEPADTTTSSCQLCKCAIETNYSSMDKARSSPTTASVPTMAFVFENVKFALFNPVEDVNRSKSGAKMRSFHRIDFPTSLSIDTYMAATGYTSESSLAVAKQKWGQNDFFIPVPSFVALLKEQLVAPFFVFQFFCMLLWCLDEYVYYSLFTLLMLVIFECTVVLQRQRNMETLNHMRRPPQAIFVFRQNDWTPISSSDLVPGDICSIGQALAAPSRSESIVPCDVLLLQGNCVVNEAMLSGESIPLRKEPLVSSSERDSDLLSIDSDSEMRHRKHVVFGGTSVLQQTTSGHSFSIRDPPDGGCIAYVLRTGFGTSQGSLMRTILHASQRVTANNAEAMCFIALLLVFALCSSGYVLSHGLADPLQDRFKLGLHCIMIITSVVPPELPMELSLAVTNSLVALTKRGIYCTEPFRVPFAGRVDVCCFDKTGTLTSDRLKVCGVAGISPDAGPQQVGTELLSAEELPLDSELTLAACHSLVLLNGKTEPSGDPLELAALKAVQWKLVPALKSDTSFTTRAIPSIASPRRDKIDSVQIMHRFAFSSELKRMSTIVAMTMADNEEDRESRLLLKGAPEVVQPLLSSVPEDYTSTYQRLASRGNRVLALAWKSLPKKWADDQIYWNRLDRKELESDLTFAGFLVLECPLKKDSKQVVSDLKDSSHRVVMVTGDNALTACDVARQVGIADTSEPTLTLNVDGESLTWDLVHDQLSQDPSSIPFMKEKVAALAAEHTLCVTGTALTFLQDKIHDFIDDKSSGVSKQDSFLRVLEVLGLHARVFARTSPQQKELLLLALNRAGKTTVMCGDGTNDVGALKRAHVGVSIVNSPNGSSSPRPSRLLYKPKQQSNAQKRLERMRREQEEEERAQVVRMGDASIASPFTSKTSSIHVVKQLIRQGRCTLVTTIQMYKILGINCLVTAYELSALYLFGVKNGDQQLTVLGLGIAVFFLFLSQAKPAKTLSKEKPPTGVFCLPVMLSIFGQFAIHLMVLVVGIRLAQPYIDANDPSMHPNGTFEPSIVNSVMFLLSSVMQVNTFVTNYRGKPFMESFWQHKQLSRSAVLAYIVLALAVMEVSPLLNETLELVDIPSEVKMYVGMLMLGDTLAVFFFERLVLIMTSKQPAKLQ